VGGLLTALLTWALTLLLRVANRLGPLRVFGASLLIRRVIEATGLTGILQVQEAAP
jgi:hypothetical protein